VGLYSRVQSLFSRDPDSPTKSSWGRRTGRRRRAPRGSILWKDSADINRKTTGGATQTFNAKAERPTDIDLSRLEQLYRQEPLAQRGIQKQSADVVREGHTLRNPDDGTEHLQNDEWQAWAREQDILSKIEDALISAHVYGDGFLELAWSDETQAGRADEEVPEEATLEAVFVADPTNLSLHEREGTDDLFAVESRMQGDLVLHPDRYEQLVLHDLPGYHHGLSTMEAAWHSAHSKVMGDQSSGEILFSCGVPFVHNRIEGADDEETDEWTEWINSDEVVRGFASDESHEITSVNPETVDPSPFYEAFLESIAAAVGMPKLMLRGAASGSIAGSKTNQRQYHEELSGVQENVLTKHVKRFVKGRLGLNADEFWVDWHAFEVDPKVQASTARDRARAMLDLVNAGTTPEAAARIVGLNLTDDDLQNTPQGPLPPGGGA
jgi:hypothetical protein